MDKESMLSRRNLLLAVGGASAAGALFSTPFGSSIALRTWNLARGLTPTAQALPLADGSHDLWMGLVGSVFVLGGGTRMRLIGVRALPGGGVRPTNLKRTRSFIAHFEPLAGATVAGEIIHIASHSLHGPFQIFLTASSDPRTPARMLAVFN